MAKLILEDLPTVEDLDREAMAEVQGGSIYVDGRYWGEGEVSMHPWPSGVPVYDVWGDGSRTPH